LLLPAAIEFAKEADTSEEVLAALERVCIPYSDPCVSFCLKQDELLGLLEAIGRALRVDTPFISPLGGGGESGNCISWTAGEEAKGLCEDAF